VLLCVWVRERQLIRDAGWLNPWIYANPQAFNDITSGTNPGCNTKVRPRPPRRAHGCPLTFDSPQGFSATKGWDPVTGMGSPNFAAMKTAAGL
jgi:tripeptidyl-peptidase-1